MCSCGHDGQAHAYSGMYGPCRLCGCDQFTAGGFLSVTADRSTGMRLSRWIMIGVAVFLVLVVAFAIVVTLP